MSNNRLWKINLNVAFRELEGELLLIHPRSGEMFAISGTGKLIWQALIDGRSETEIISSLSETYSVDEKVVREDVSAFLEFLAQDDFIVPVSN